jgi:hypothetical protein
LSNALSYSAAISTFRSTEFSGYTTTVLAHRAAELGHEVMYITPSDFLTWASVCDSLPFPRRSKLEGEPQPG